MVFCFYHSTALLLRSTLAVDAILFIVDLLETIKQKTIYVSDNADNPTSLSAQLVYAVLYIAKLSKLWYRRAEQTAQPKPTPLVLPIRHLCDILQNKSTVTYIRTNSIVCLCQFEWNYTIDCSLLAFLPSSTLFRLFCVALPNKRQFSGGYYFFEPPYHFFHVSITSALYFFLHSFYFLSAFRSCCYRLFIYAACLAYSSSIRCYLNACIVFWFTLLDDIISSSCMYAHVQFSALFGHSNREWFLSYCGWLETISFICVHNVLCVVYEAWFQLIHSHFFGFLHINHIFFMRWRKWGRCVRPQVERLAEKNSMTRTCTRSPKCEHI